MTHDVVRLFFFTARRYAVLYLSISVRLSVRLSHSNFTETAKDVVKLFSTW